MRRPPSARSPRRAVPDASGGDTSSGDWTARHARTRSSPDGSNVRADDPIDDDWVLRHSRTRGR